ncbi:KH domain-containing protein [Pseudanabaena sp. PCC 6802]|uniref:KH domain-containing protein n=1 Tax=Pseudanabaena sp. PCC 6802 TaxID=118173 RepID=UPI00034B805E|nr:KH domain-containing protein [Pseudanabaena sp. PCC 6802]
MPDYLALVKFLIEPLLDSQDALRLDCETNSKGDRLRVRVAFDPADRGRVVGRNGRTLQAIRTVVNTAAQSANQVVHLDVYDPNPGDKHADKEVKHSHGRSSPRRKRVN